VTAAGSQANDNGANAPALSLLRVLGRRWFHIVIAVVVAGALGLIFSMTLTPQYKSSARIFLNTTPSDSTTANSSVDPSRVVQTQAQLATSSQTIAAVAKRLQVPSAYVGARVTATPAASGYFFTITAVDDTQKKATSLVLETRTAYSNLLDSYAGADTTTIKRLEGQRDDAQREFIGAQGNAASVWQNVVTGLNKRIGDARLAIAGGDTTIGLAEDPLEAGQTSPSLFINVLIGALLGLFLSAAVIWIRYLRSPTVLDGRAAADAIGAPLIVGPSSGSGSTPPTIDTIVSAMAAVLSPTVKVVALTPAGIGDLTAETVAAVAASWSDDQGVVLVLDASPSSDIRAVLERLPRATSGELPRWAHDPTCLARSSGSGRGHVLYNRVSPSRASRPGGLAPILADRAPVVDLVLLLTPPLTDLPMTAASALQADAVVVITSEVTRVDELAQVPRDWPALAERIVGVIHSDRAGFRPSVIAAEGRSAGGRAAPAPPALDVHETRGTDPESTDRYARPGGSKY
jgi:capsular polysaccharide biosynthesis protein